MDQDALEKYEKLLAAALPDVKRKGKTVPYTSLNGHMFTFLSKEETVGMRLSPEDRAALMEQYGLKLVVQYGKTMKEFVDIPLALLEEGDLAVEYFKKSLAYTASLKPKATKKKS